MRLLAFDLAMVSGWHCRNAGKRDRSANAPARIALRGPALHCVNFGAWRLADMAIPFDGLEH